MPRTSEAIALVASHCDLVDRLRHVPPSASIRGVFFHNITLQLERAGQLSAFQAFFPDDRHGVLPFYPLGDFLVRLACAGALVRSPSEVHEGMRAICRGHKLTFSRSLLGRALLRLLAREPRRLTEQGLAARRQTYRYGRWSLVQHAVNELEVRYEDEYQWIESAVTGSAEGTYESCVPKVHIETHLTSRFAGSTFLRWAKS